MRHIKAFLTLIAVVMAFTACEKHVIAYDSETIQPGSAEFQLHYFVPVVAGAANNITKVEINDKLYTNQTGPLSTYNAVPSGAVGRFFNAPAGNTNIKLYRGANQDLVYDQNVTLQSGKQNVFVHDFTKPPVVIDNGFPYPRNVTDTTDNYGWVRFYNFLYETAGVPTDKTLQYQYQYVTDRASMTKSDWINVGDPVSFGQATDWEMIPVVREVITAPSSSYARVDYRILVKGNASSPDSLLKVRNASGSMVDYADWWTAYVGRHYMHILAGFRAATPISAVRQFTAN